MDIDYQSARQIDLGCARNFRRAFFIDEQQRVVILAKRGGPDVAHQQWHTLA